MTRFVLFPLLFALVLPVFAQDEQPPLQSTLPPPLQPMVQPGIRDPRLFSQERERITFELQQIQRLIGVIRPDDVQTMDALKAQQVELAKQLRDLTQQMQAGPQPGIPNIPEVLPGGMGPQVPLPGMRPEMNAIPSLEVVPPPEQRIPLMPGMPGGMGYQIPNNQMPAAPPVMPSPMPNPQMQMYAPAVPAPSWADQDRAWETAQWGPRLPKELTEVKQSVDSLQKEVADLKDTIKALEAQIQLLTRNILLSERVKENGN